MNRILASFLLAAATTFAADISGDWELTARLLGDTQYVRITLKADGNKLTGTLNELKFDGTIDGNKLAFTANRPNGETFGTFEGAIHGNEISGTALWHHPGRLVPIRYVLVRDVAGELRPQAFLCTDLDADPINILRWFVRRWSIEVTFAEVRRHLGVETQRQWSDPAIARTTPALFGLFSLIALWAHDLYAGATPRPDAASWYRKPLPTFSDAIAAVRRELWTSHNFNMPKINPDLVKIPRATINLLINAACYAA